MSAQPAVYQTDENTQRRTFLVGIRLFLAANTMLMGGFLFGYLYLRATNNAGMWRPDGIDDLSGIGIAVVLVLHAATLGAVAVAIGAVRRGSHRAVGAVALLIALVAVVARIWYQYHFGSGWVFNNGTYVAITEMWLGFLLVESVVGLLWLFSIVIPGESAAHPLVAARHLRGFAEFWGYLLVVSTFVFVLARLV